MENPLIARTMAQVRLEGGGQPVYNIYWLTPTFQPDLYYIWLNQSDVMNVYERMVVISCAHFANNVCQNIHKNLLRSKQLRLPYLVLGDLCISVHPHNQLCSHRLRLLNAQPVKY